MEYVRPKMTKSYVTADCARRTMAATLSNRWQQLLTYAFARPPAAYKDGCCFFSSIINTFTKRFRPKLRGCHQRVGARNLFSASGNVCSVCIMAQQMEVNGDRVSDNRQRWHHSHHKFIRMKARRSSRFFVHIITYTTFSGTWIVSSKRIEKHN